MCCACKTSGIHIKRRWLSLNWNYYSISPDIFLSYLKIVEFHIGISTSAPATTKQSTKPETTNQGMRVMIVICYYREEAFE